MLHFKWTLFQISVGVDVRVGVEKENNVPSKIFVSGTIGGGITIGKPNWIAGNLYAFRTVTWFV